MVAAAAPTESVTGDPFDALGNAIDTDQRWLVGALFAAASLHIALAFTLPRRGAPPPIAAGSNVVVDIEMPSPPDLDEPSPPRVVAPPTEGLTDLLSGKVSITSVSIQETSPDSELGRHADAARQLVITLSGTLEFSTRNGAFRLGAGDVLFTEENGGTGHDWRLLDRQPWRRIYAALDAATAVPFQSTKTGADTCLDAYDYGRERTETPILRRAPYILSPAHVATCSAAESRRQPSPFGKRFPVVPSPGIQRRSGNWSSR